VCNKPVDGWSIEYGMNTIHSYAGQSFIVSSGEVIVTVRCHGESITISNWRGIIEKTTERWF
jgi:hypothetical protein